MKKLRFPLVILALLAALAATPVQAGSASSPGAGAGVSIAAVVNKEAITGSELAARTKLIVVSSGLPDTPEVREKIRPQIINTLIEERLMMQDAQNGKIDVSKDDIKAGFAELAKQNNMTAEQFEEVLNHGGIPINTLYDQIKAQIAWGRVIQAKIRPDITITDDMIDTALERLKSDIGKTQYLVADIFLPVTTPQDEASVHQVAEKLTREITDNHAPFSAVARQFSQAPGAEKGGDIGWIQDDQAQPELAKALADMKEGDLSKPVRTPEGYHILLLRQKNVLSAETLPSRDDLTEKLGLQELDRRQRRHLMDLKAQAFIERRA